MTSSGLYLLIVCHWTPNGEVHLRSGRSQDGKRSEEGRGVSWGAQNVNWSSPGTLTAFGGLDLTCSGGRECITAAERRVRTQEATAIQYRRLASCISERFVCVRMRWFSASIGEGFPKWHGRKSGG
jgi:hypothetical protein